MEQSPRFAKLVDEARPRVSEISTDEVAARLRRGDEFHLVDIREESEVTAGRITRAKHIGRGILERDIEKTIPDPGADIVLYCRGGLRSILSAESLQRMGYTNVRSMTGGFREWQKKQLPVE